MPTTYITDWFLTALQEEHDTHETDGDLEDWFGNFCSHGTHMDESPNWDENDIRYWVRDIMNHSMSYSITNDTLLHAMFMDIDEYALKERIIELHETYWENKAEMAKDTLKACASAPAA
jgi:hypothetical protein